MQTNAVNCSPTDDNAALNAVLEQLTLDQIRFVVARQDCGTDREAARLVGVSESTVNHWPKIVKDAVRLMAYDGLATARHVRRRNLAKAMLVKVRGLDSGDEKIRQSVATEIIEWEMGRAETPLSMKRADELTDDELAAIAASGGTGATTPEDDPA